MQIAWRDAWIKGETQTNIRSYTDVRKTALHTLGLLVINPNLCFDEYIEVTSDIFIDATYAFKLIIVNATSDITITIPTSETLPINTMLGVINFSGVNITIVGNVIGKTISNIVNEGLAIRKTNNNEWAIA